MTDPRKLYPFVEHWHWVMLEGTEYVGTPVVVLHYGLRPSLSGTPIR